jgi:hypothetical protein
MDIVIGYRRSLRFMSEDALRAYIAAEIEQFSKAIHGVSNEIAAATSDSHLSPEEVKACLDSVSPDNPSIVLLREIFDAIKQVTKSTDTSLFDEISDLDITRNDLYETVITYRNSHVDTMINKFSCLKSEICVVFAECTDTLTSDSPTRSDLDRRNSQLAAKEQEIIESYNDVRSWTEGKVPPYVRQSMDKITQDIRALSETINSLLIQDDNDENDQSSSSAFDSAPDYTSSQSVKSAVSRAKSLVETMKRNKSAKVNHKKAVRNALKLL